MEVYLETGETITAHNLKTQAIPPRYKPVWFGLTDTNREDLYARIDSRVNKMLEDGLIQEIQMIYAFITMKPRFIRVKANLPRDLHPYKKTKAIY